MFSNSSAKLIYITEKPRGLCATKYTMSLFNNRWCLTMIILILNNITIRDDLYRVHLTNSFFLAMSPLFLIPWCWKRLHQQNILNCKRMPKLVGQRTELLNQSDTISKHKLKQSILKGIESLPQTQTYLYLI